MTRRQNNTLRVKSQHHVLTHAVFNLGMKTIGDRIRQAREFRKMSGEELAQRVGYSHQSGIGNLEARATGSGGHKIVAIARTLNFALSWFMSGPDTDDMTSVPAFEDAAQGRAHTAQESLPAAWTHGRVRGQSQDGAKAWPFKRVTPAEYFNLPDTHKAMVEGYIHGLIQESVHTKSAIGDQANGK